MSSVDSDVDTWHCCDNVPVVVNIVAASLQLTYLVVLEKVPSEGS